MDDSIARQSAIETVHEAIYEFFDLVDDDAESPMTYLDKKLLEVNKAITNRLKNLPSAQPEHECENCIFSAFKQFQPRWIPVTERLPKDGERVLVTYDILENYPWINILQFGHDELNRSEQGFYYYDDEWGDCPISGVKAWMPLPEPYKKETEDETSD